MSEGSQPKAARKSSERPLSGSFKLAFFSVLTLTGLSFVAILILAIWGDPKSEVVRSQIETFSTTWKMGFVAIIGLIGGKAL